MTKTEFLTMVKQHMRNNKNQWLSSYFNVDGKKVGIKLFNKYLQILEIDGLYCGGCEFKTQKELIQYINDNID